ncbi:hypothetical protein B0H17DRAFT_1146476 [Mycena rosella]|uniref:Uncharacterized protein n=1 Tax=Mycena rosella TaxID=1033263 RepID=A0AAD7CNW6_MYCRO|nr:hypothetical protein B0H17DRAFT_1146476 [Mycena rosella]
MDNIEHWIPVPDRDRFGPSVNSSCRYFTVGADIPSESKILFEKYVDPLGTLARHLGECISHCLDNDVTYLCFKIEKYTIKDPGGFRVGNTVEMGFALVAFGQPTRGEEKQIFLNCMLPKKQENGIRGRDGSIRPSETSTISGSSDTASAVIVHKRYYHGPPNDRGSDRSRKNRFCAMVFPRQMELGSVIFPGVEETKMRSASVRLSHRGDITRLEARKAAGKSAETKQKTLPHNLQYDSATTGPIYELKKGRDQNGCKGGWFCI